MWLRRLSGRGFFILDDYTPLRDINETALEEEALLFPGRRAWWYIERHPLAFTRAGAQGHGYYQAPNPPFGANFTYYLKEDLQTRAEIRQEAEKDKLDAWDDTPFVGFDAAEEERREVEPEIWLTVRDAAGNVVRRINGPIKKGIHRVAWDLRYPAMTPVGDGPSYPYEEVTGYFAAPGTYTVSLSKRVRGVTTELVGPQEFVVERLREGVIAGADPAAAVAFWDRLGKLERGAYAASNAADNLEARIDDLKIALSRTRAAPDNLDDQWQAIRTEWQDIVEILSGNQAMAEIGQEPPATILSRISNVEIGTSQSTYGPTPTHITILEVAEADFEALRVRLNTLQQTTIPAFEAALIEAGAPWTPGGLIPAQ